MFRSVLVGVGASPAHTAALEQAIDLALGERARLTLLAALPRLPAVAYLAPLTPVVALQDARSTCESELRAAAARVPGDLPVTTLLVEGPEHQALLREVRRGRHDLVVVGAPTTRRLPADLGASARLARRCPVPVMLVREPPEAGGQSAAAARPSAHAVLGLTRGKHARA